ncbi:PAAR domain-containing protein [Methanohalobium sp.]|uniref:PAAR domain-containing protein n=1 Tax=Methanohalobium sp. TaxID=2837493 RepID=UPI0034E0A759
MPAVTRVGDADVPHCSGMVRAQGSPNVFVNNIAVSREGDLNTVHLLPGSPCPSHSAPISSGSSTVYINGKQCGRVGDPTCTSVAEGSPNVFAGG